MAPKNSYRWVPMISGHGTEKLFSMGFEILGLGITDIKIMYKINRFHLAVHVYSGNAVDVNTW